MLLWIPVKFRSVSRNSEDISRRKKTEQPPNWQSSLRSVLIDLCEHHMGQGIDIQISLTSCNSACTLLLLSLPHWKLNTSLWIITHKFRPISGQIFVQRVFLPTFLRTILNTHHFLQPWFFCPCSWGALLCFSARETQIFPKHPLAKLLCTLKPALPFILNKTCFGEGDG